MSLLSSLAGPLLGAAGSAAGGYFAAQAAKKAAKLKLKMQREAIAEQRRVAGVAEGLYRPGAELWQPALSKLTNLSGLGGRRAQEEAYGEFVESPGVAWLRARGMQGIERSNAGQGRTGRTLLDLSKFNQGLAEQDFGNYYGRISDIANRGERAVGATANAHLGVGNNITNILNDEGDTMADGAIGVGNAFTTAAQGIGDSLAYGVSRFGAGGGTSSYGGSSRLPMIANRSRINGQIGPT